MTTHDVVNHTALAVLNTSYDMHASDGYFARYALQSVYQITPSAHTIVSHECATFAHKAIPI